MFMLATFLLPTGWKLMGRLPLESIGLESSASRRSGGKESLRVFASHFAIAKLMLLSCILPPKY